MSAAAGEEIECIPEAEVRIGLGGRVRLSRMSISLRRVLIITLIWRLIVAAIGVAAHFLALPGDATFSLLRTEGWSANPVTLALDSCVRYDAIWYGTIAQHGYTFVPGAALSTINFYPLFPLTVKLGSLLTGSVWIAGIAIANVCLVGSAVLLQEWLRMRGLERHAPLATLLLLVFPGSVFFGFMYTESLYLLLCLATLVLYERGRFFPAAGTAFLLTLTRPTGILIVVWVVWSALGRRRVWQSFMPALGSVMGAGAFAVYQWAVFGSPTAQIQAASEWPVTPRTFAQGMSDLTLRATPGHSAAALVMLELSGILFLAVLPLVYRYFGAAYAAYAAACIVVPTLTGLASYQRYLAVIFVVPAALAVWRDRRARRSSNLAIFGWLWWNLVFTVAAAALYVSEGGAF